MRTRTSLAATPLRVEGDGFLLTYSGQSAINCLYRVWFHGQFCILNLSSTEDTRTNDHVPQVTFSVRPDRRNGFRKMLSPPDTEKFLGWLNRF
jgi:hypothetical protein